MMKCITRFLDFPPIFKNSELKNGTKKLISCMSAKKILIYYPLMEWYIQQGLIVTKVYGMIHCKNGKYLKGLVSSYVVKEEKEI